MPIYAFKCPACGTQFDKLQKHSDPAPACTTCAKPTERQVTAANFEFNGSGYYCTDFKNKR